MVELSEQQLEDVLAFSIDLAKSAGSIILEGSHSIRSQTISEKKNAGGSIQF
jgi:hypothetical protein